MQDERLVSDTNKKQGHKWPQFLVNLKDTKVIKGSATTIMMNNECIKF